MCVYTGLLRANSHSPACRLLRFFSALSVSRNSRSARRVSGPRYSMSKQSAGVCGYTGTLRANSQGGGGGECVRVHQYSMSKQSGSDWAGQGGGGGECVRVHRYTMSKQSG